MRVKTQSSLPKKFSSEKKMRPKARIMSRAATTTSTRPPIAAAKAKEQFLRLLDEVEQSQESITITKRGRVVARLGPAAPESELSAYDQVFGSMKGSVKILGDIVSPDWDAWGPEWR